MFQDVIAAIPLGIIMAFLFGPVFFVLLETAALKGTRPAIIFDIGVILADTVFLLIAYFSTNRLLTNIKDDPNLFVFGGGILTTYGIVTFIHHKRNLFQLRNNEVDSMRKGDWFTYFTKGFLLNFVNIGVLGFWVGIIIAFGPTMEMDPDRMMVFFATVLITYFVTDLLKIFAAKKLNHKLTPRRIFRVKRVISVVIAIFGLILIARGVFPTEMERVQDQVEQVMPEDV